MRITIILILFFTAGCVHRKKHISCNPEDSYMIPPDCCKAWDCME